MNKKHLLIIGAGIEQIRAYELAHEMGYGVVASDMNSNAPALSYADYTIIASTRDPEETIRGVVQFQKSHKPIDGVMTLANDVPLTVAMVARRFGLPGVSVISAELASNKLAMKEKFLRDGIKVPQFKEIVSVDEIDKLATLWSFPLVIKPNDGRGARGVLLLNGKTSHKWAFQHAKNNSDSGRVLAEKFIHGIQLSTESIIYKGNCYTASISHRNYEYIERFSPYIIENGGVLPIDLDGQTARDIECIIVKAAKSMGIKRGTIKGDIVLSEDGPKVIEMAARLSGGYLCTDQIPLARGVDLVKQSIKLAMGETLAIEELKPQNLCTMGIRYFFPKPGRIKKITGFKELDRYDWVSKKMLFLHEGDIVEPPTNHTQRTGFVHVTAASYEEAESRAITAANEVQFETVPV